MGDFRDPHAVAQERYDLWLHEQEKPMSDVDPKAIDCAAANMPSGFYSHGIPQATRKGYARLVIDALVRDGHMVPAADRVVLTDDHQVCEQRLRRAEAELEAARTAIPDPDKLDMPAELFDKRDNETDYRGVREVQNDPRAWATAARAFLASVPEAGDEGTEEQEPRDE